MGLFEKCEKFATFMSTAFAFELLLQTVYNIRSANMAMNLYINNANVDG